MLPSRLRKQVPESFYFQEECLGTAWFWQLFMVYRYPGTYCYWREAHHKKGDVLSLYRTSTYIPEPSTSGPLLSSLPQQPTPPPRTRGDGRMAGLWERLRCQELQLSCMGLSHRAARAWDRSVGLPSSRVCHGVRDLRFSTEWDDSVTATSPLDGSHRYLGGIPSPVQSSRAMQPSRTARMRRGVSSEQAFHPAATRLAAVLGLVYAATESRARRSGTHLPLVDLNTSVIMRLDKTRQDRTTR